MMETTPLLIQWYREHRRELPWRETADPYEIWVAEVILQQTRVQQGLSYYTRFLGLFPGIKALAEAPPDMVMKAWQGLGYYSRARNMQAAARQIIDIHNGHFPSDYDEIISLKGIGEYTASAIMSFAYGKPYPVMDGNVIRFISRLYGIREPVDTARTKKIIRGYLEEMIDREDPATFNQAVMEFGALQCTPAVPDCLSCIFRDRCVAFREHLVDMIPVKKAKQKTRELRFDYFVPLWKKEGQWFTLVKKRSSPGIWRGLYEFPLVVTGEREEGPGPEQGSVIHSILRTGELISETTPYRHVLTHREISAVFRIIRMDDRPEGDDILNYMEVSMDELFDLPVSRLLQNFLENDLTGLSAITGG